MKLACVHYAFAKHLTFEQVQSEPWYLIGRDRDTGLSAESTRLIEAIQFSPSKADKLIIDYLKDGYCHPKELVDVITRLNENSRRAEAESCIQAVWHLIYDGFTADIAAVERAVSLCIRSHGCLLPIDSLTYLVETIHDIDAQFDERGAVEALALEAVQTADTETLGKIKAADISPVAASAIQMRRDELAPKHEIGKLIASLSYPDGWNPGDFALLNKYPDAELQDWLLAAEGDRLIGDIAVVVVRARTSGEGEGGPDLANKIKRVMTALADRNKLNEYRIDKYFAAKVKRGLAERGISDV